MSKSSFPSIDFSVIEPICLPQNKQGHQLFILREDLIHSIISGNKWRKLKYVFEFVQTHKFDGLITYGGAYSNHLVACAAAAKLHGIHCVLKVRGEELEPNSNEYLSFCKSQGAELHFISRADFHGEKHIYGPLEIHGKTYFSIPEGGAHALGLKGCLEIVDQSMDYDFIALAQGTTTTSLGVLLSSSPNTEVWVFPVLKGFDSIQEMQTLAKKFDYEEEWNLNKHRLRVFSNYHFSGYGKGSHEVQQALNELQVTTDFDLDKVYTMKAFVGLLTELNQQNNSLKGLFIHTGGVFSNGLF